MYINVAQMSDFVVRVQRFSNIFITPVIILAQNDVVACIRLSND